MRTRTLALLLVATLIALHAMPDGALSAWAKGGQASSPGGKPAKPPIGRALSPSDLKVLHARSQSDKIPRPRRLDPSLVRRKPWTGRLAQLRNLHIEPSPQAGDVYAVLTARTPYVSRRAGLCTSGEAQWSASGREWDGIVLKVPAVANSLFNQGSTSALIARIHNTVPNRRYLVEFQAWCGPRREIRLWTYAEGTRVQELKFRPPQGDGYEWYGVVIECQGTGDAYSVGIQGLPGQARTTFYDCAIRECRITVL